MGLLKQDSRSLLMYLLLYMALVFQLSLHFRGYPNLLKIPLSLSVQNSLLDVVKELLCTWDLQSWDKEMRFTSITIYLLAFGDFIFACSICGGSGLYQHRTSRKLQGAPQLAPRRCQDCHNLRCRASSGCRHVLQSKYFYYRGNPLIYNAIWRSNVTPR